MHKISAWFLVYAISIKHKTDGNWLLSCCTRTDSRTFSTLMHMLRSVRARACICVGGWVRGCVLVYACAHTQQILRLLVSLCLISKGSELHELCISWQQIRRLLKSKSCVCSSVFVWALHISHSHVQAHSEHLEEPAQSPHAGNWASHRSFPSAHVAAWSTASLRFSCTCIIACVWRHCGPSYMFKHEVRMSKAKLLFFVASIRNVIKVKEMRCMVLIASRWWDMANTCLQCVRCMEHKSLVWQS